MDKEIKIPKWFNGEIYENGAAVQNLARGTVYTLNNVELSVYDYILDKQKMFQKDDYSKINAQELRDFEKALYWFRANNPRAYKVLLD